MAVKLKLTRLGSKKHPFYRVVAADAEKVKAWLDRGAEPTDTVRALLKKMA